jgi:hypothetical protein
LIKSALRTNTQGIYRVSGQKSKIEKLVSSVLVMNIPADLTKEDCQTITSAVKSILYDLPEPIFTFSLHDSLVAILGKRTCISLAFLGFFCARHRLDVQTYPASRHS